MRSYRRIRRLFQRLESGDALSKLSVPLVALLLSFPASGQGQILLDGDFDTLTVGTAPDRGTPNGAWSFPDSYGSTSAGDQREPLSRKGIISVVETASFDATRSGNSLKVQIASTDSVVLVNMLSEKITEADGGILRVKFDTFVPQRLGGGGMIILGSDPVGFGGISYWTDQGPLLDWRSNGNLMNVECINFSTSCDPGSNPGSDSTSRLALRDYPRDTWQHVQLDIDLAADKYDLYHSANDEPLSLVKSGLGFSSGKQREIDRLLISGAWWGGTSVAYFDNFSATWAPSTPYETVSLSGAGGVYRQDFDAALGMDSSDNDQPLPTGWIGSRNGLITTDKTTKAFPAGSLTTGTLLYNAGAVQDADRALAIGIGSRTSQGTLQLLANVTDTNAEQLQLSFDLEVWDVANSNTTVNPGEAAFDVSIEIDQGDGFVPLLDLGRVTTGATLQKPLTVTDYLNGNDPSYRVTFDSGVLPASIPVGSLLRVNWSADQAASRGWVFGLDNVSFSLLGGHPFGDFNSDGILGIDDLDQLSAEIAAGNTDAMYDVDQSGVVDLADRQYWVTGLKRTWIGDANLDGEFNSGDFTTVFLVGEYEDVIEDNSGWAEGDWDGDGDFTSGDFVVAFLDGGYEKGPRMVAGAVPEPTSMAIVITALIGIAMRRRMLPVARSRRLASDSR